MFLHALEEMIPPLFMRFFSFPFSLVARDIWPQELPVIRWNTSTQVDWCFPLASYARFERCFFFLSIYYRETERHHVCLSLLSLLQVQLMFSSRFHVDVVRR